MNSLLDKARVEIKLGDFGVAPATALDDASLLPRVQEYRRQTGSRMYPLDKDDIKKKIPTADYHVSRKVDGEFSVLAFRDGQAITLNPGGTVRVGMPWQDEAARLLAKADIKEAVFAGELYVDVGDRRPRVHDITTLARQPKSQDDLRRIRFAVFDILSLDGNPPGDTFAETWNLIQKLFGSGESIHPVETKSASDADGVERLFERWVEQEGAEGLVVRSDTAGIFKVKPRHTLDATVLGFTESVGDRQGLLHDLLLGVVRQDGTLQVLSRVGGGFDDDQRREILSDLKDMVVESEYAEVNSDHVAYQMVHPDWVVEISCLDLISQTTRGGPVNRMVLDFSENGSSLYRVVRRLPLAAVISPQFIRRREDKQVRPDDVSIAQVTKVVEVPLADRDARQLTLPKSEILQRDVYTKILKGQTMVRKFVLLKTNKETQSDEYPAYACHFTDFSPNRKTPLSREVRVSSSREQIGSLFQELVEANIKKGWQPTEAAAQTTPEAVVEVAQKPAAERPKKKKAVVKKGTAKPTKAAKKPKAAKKKMAASERTRKKKAKKKSG